MIVIDPTKATWLAAIGTLYDIVGAVVLIRALMWARPLELFRAAVQVWDADAELLRAQCTQKVDALWGTTILVFGFLLQALSSMGVSIDGWIAWILVAVLVALLAVFHFWLRAKHFRRWYMRAVDAATCEQNLKDEIKRAY
jgi:hypothetical protein